MLDVHRVYVDTLTGGDDAKRFRDLLIAALQNAKLFTITENPERADTFLRGAASDETYEDKFSSSDRLNARTFVGGSSGNRKTATGNNKIPVDITVGEDESTKIEERKHEAVATVRLVDKDGDVLWSTTKESAGAKFRGASADMADKIVKELIATYNQLRTSSRGPATEINDNPASK